MAKKSHTEDKSSTKSAAEAATPHDWGEFRTDDQLKAYQHFSKLVADIPEAERLLLRGDTKIIINNVDKGVAAFRARATDIQKQLPACDIKSCLESSALALGLDYAAGRVATAASDNEIAAKQKLLRPLRAAMLQQLDVFAFFKLVPAERVKAIRANSGPMDMADDGVKIYGVFHEFAAALKGKHPFPEAMIEEIGALGNWLVAALTPGGAQAAPSQRTAEQIVRDQFYTELTHRYDTLREAAVTVYGLKKLDDSVPPLLSRVLGPHEKDPAPAGPPATSSIESVTMPDAKTTGGKGAGKKE